MGFFSGKYLFATYLWFHSSSFFYGETINVKENRRSHKKNGQSIDTGNAGHKVQELKTNKKHNIAQHKKLKRWTTRTPPKNRKTTGVNPCIANSISSSCFLYDTWCVTHRVESSKSLVSDRGQKKIFIKGKRSIWAMDIKTSSWWRQYNFCSDDFNLWTTYEKCSLVWVAFQSYSWLVWFCPKSWFKQQ